MLHDTRPTQMHDLMCTFSNVLRFPLPNTACAVCASPGRHAPVLTTGSLKAAPGSAA